MNMFFTFCVQKRIHIVIWSYIRWDQYKMNFPSFRKYELPDVLTKFLLGICSCGSCNGAAVSTLNGVMQKVKIKFCYKFRKSTIWHVFVMGDRNSLLRDHATGTFLMITRSHILLCVWNDSLLIIWLLSCPTLHTTLIIHHQTFSFFQDWNQ